LWTLCGERGSGLARRQDRLRFRTAVSSGEEELTLRELADLDDRFA
jgi:hypothetical protein